MCGVVGFSCDAPTPEHHAVLRRLMNESKIRGLHSFGLAYVEDGIQVRKSHDLARLDIPSRATRVIFHNRYSTSGDYLDHNNNQPLANEQVALAFNGVLDMRTKEEMEEAYNIIMPCDNDGALLLELCDNDPSQMLAWTKEQNASFAGLILSSKNVLWAFRNTNRPLWMDRYKGALYFASTRDIFKRANPAFDPVQLRPDVIYGD